MLFIVSSKQNAANYYLYLYNYAVLLPPSNVQVSQNGLNSVLVTWTPSGIYVTGYTIFYQQQGEQSVSAKGVGNTTEATISGLITGSTYNISVSAESSIRSSSSTIAPNITLGIA